MGPDHYCDAISRDYSVADTVLGSGHAKMDTLLLTVSPRSKKEVDT